MSDYLPDEIIKEILTKLPVKSLLRFTAVCKSWYSHIKNPSFINAHLNQTIANTQHSSQRLLVRYYDKTSKEEQYTLRWDDDKFGDQFSALNFPFKSVLGYVRIVGSCNGLLCLCDDLFGDANTITLWNPSIRKAVNVDMRINLRFPHMFVLGFGVCPVTRDAKVVRIVYVRDATHRNRFVVPPKVEVYALSSGTWRSAVEIAAPPCYLTEFTWSQAFVSGFVHWVAYSKVCPRNLIVRFDIRNEVFGEMVLPDDLCGELVSNLSVAVRGESLAMLKYNKEIGTCCVWVMKEYGVAGSWTKLFTIDLPGMLRRTIGFRKNGEVMLSLISNELVSYDPNKKEIKYLGVQGNIRSFYVDTYMESLALLERGVAEYL
ncbi:hypothetical protein RJ639_046098 [Escallonia herrerae]|uniref:F-box domain-containing protein n=1 Tax=Escallonia herrerae TaxID=1293975 RepID=A0AA89B0Y7_9ASTE|nr:hypothetical protein RJ639_046098 [Escallonia herrerae]